MEYDKLTKYMEEIRAKMLEAGRWIHIMVFLPCIIPLGYFD